MAWRKYLEAVDHGLGGQTAAERASEIATQRDGCRAWAKQELTILREALDAAEMEVERGEPGVSVALRLNDHAHHVAVAVRNFGRCL